MFNKLKETIKELKLKQDLESRDIWIGSKFEDINDLKIDYSGKVGELSIFPFLIENTDWNIKYSYDNNTNTNDGIYDGVINGYRVEVKTARLGKSSSRNIFGGNFQHENLKQLDECDYVIFIDITPNYFFITVKDFRNIDLTKEIKEFGIVPHKRKSTTDIFKIDLKESTSITRAVNSGISIPVNEDTDPKDIIKFLSKFFSVPK
jgi:hypothetical protein